MNDCEWLSFDIPITVYIVTSDYDNELRIVQRLDIEEPLDGLQEDVEREGVEEAGDGEGAHHLQPHPAVAVPGPGLPAQPAHHASRVFLDGFPALTEPVPG